MRGAFESAELRRVMSRMIQVGVVRERDHQKGVRVAVGAGLDGKEALSSWVNPPDSNGSTRSRHLPSVGSQCVLLSLPGSDESMVAIPIGHHEDSPNPAESADQTVLFDGQGCRISIENNKIVMKAGASQITLEDGKISLSSDLVRAIGAELKHNDRNVGDDHRHTDVMLGGSLTGEPQ